MEKVEIWTSGPCFLLVVLRLLERRVWSTETGPSDAQREPVLGSGGAGYVRVGKGEGGGGPELVLLVHNQLWGG